jgi:phage gp36-like protein
MSYASLDDLKKTYGEPMLVALTDRAEPPAGSIDTAVVDRALADTDAAIDGYLKVRYALPLASTPALVRDLAERIAVYKLHRNVAADKIRDDYNDAIKTLRDIASGAVRLDVAGAEPTASGTQGVRASDRPRDLTPDNLRGFV